MISEVWLLAFLFFGIAVVYASVGFGGGSSYLALLALAGLQLEIIRPTALLCNVIVVAGSVYIFSRSGALPWRRTPPFLVTSIPMAFVGGSWRITDADVFFTLLAVCLLLAAFLLWTQPHARQTRTLTSPLMEGLIGGSIGLLSGLIGIGGGIFLSPILHLLRWGDARQISATASLFILANSLSGLGGQLTAMPTLPWSYILPLAGAVFLGGQMGAQLGAQKFNPFYIKRITAVVIVAAALRILVDHV